MSECEMCSNYTYDDEYDEWCCDADIDEYDTGDIHEFLQQGDIGELLENLPGTEKLTEETKKEVFRMVWMFTHGVATLVVSRRVDMDEGEIEGMLKKAYEGFVKIS